MFRQALHTDEGVWRLLRNDPDALFWSGNQKPISYEEHHNWFRRVITNPRHYLSLFEDDVTDVFGRIQLSTEAEVSFGVAKGSRGKGMGTAMLGHLEEEADCRGVDRLVAYVHPSNIASMRAFMKSGYWLDTGHKQYQRLIKNLKNR